MIVARTRTWFWRLLLPVVALGAFVLFPQTSCAQNERGPTSDDMRFGFQVFHSLLENQGVETTTDLQSLHDDPGSGVIVLLGDVKQNNLLSRARIDSFIQQGGCVLLATDHAVWADQLCVIQRGPAIVNEEFAYQDFTDCPRVTVLRRSQLLRGCTELIANRAGWIDTMFPQQGSWQPIAWLPGERAGQDTGRILIATLDSRRSRRGHMVALADHSLLINGMVLHGDNARFMLNLSRHLTEDRRTKLFISVDGLPLTSSGQPIDKPAELPPLPPPDELPPIDLNDL